MLLQPEADQAKLETRQLLKLIFCLLDRGAGHSDETQLFAGMTHQQLVNVFTEYINQHRHYMGYCHIEQSHALNDRGVDIILRAPGGKIGIQIKSHFDVKEVNFAANVKRQYTESLAHGLTHYIILICCPLRKEDKVDLQHKVSHLLNELSSMKTEYHSAYGPLNTVRYFMGLQTLSRDELLLRRAIDSDALNECEKGYEHLPEINDEEIRAAQHHFESFGEDWWDEPDGQKAFDELNAVLKPKAAEQFINHFFPTLPPDVKQRRSELVSTAQTLLAACRECKSWSERSEYKLPQWLDNVDEEMVPYTSMPNLIGIAQSLKQYLAVHVEMDARLTDAGKEPQQKGPLKCQKCGRSMKNVGADPNQPPAWICRNSRCLNSVWHRDSRCPKCGKPPFEITDGGVGFTSFLCEDGHPFTTLPQRK